MIGGPVAGVVSANYSGPDRARLGGWELADVDERPVLAPDTMILDADFGHFPTSGRPNGPLF